MLGYVVGSYPTLCLRVPTYLQYVTDPSRKTQYPKQGQGMTLEESPKLNNSVSLSTTCSVYTIYQYWYTPVFHVNRFLVRVNPCMPLLSDYLSLETLTFLVAARLSHLFFKNRLGARASARIDMASKSCTHHSADIHCFSFLRCACYASRLQSLQLLAWHSRLLSSALHHHSVIHPMKQLSEHLGQAFGASYFSGPWVVRTQGSAQAPSLDL